MEPVEQPGHMSPPRSAGLTPSAIVAMVGGLVTVAAAFQPWADSGRGDIKVEVSGLGAWPGILALVAGVALMAFGALGVSGTVSRPTLVRVALGAGAVAAVLGLIAAGAADSLFHGAVVDELAKTSRFGNGGAAEAAGHGEFAIRTGGGAYLAIAGGATAIAAGLIGLAAERKRSSRP